MNIRRYTLTALTIMTATIVVDMIWLPYSNISLDRDALFSLGVVEFCFLLLYSYGCLVTVRLRNDNSRFGRMFCYSARAAKAMFLYLAVATPVAAGICVLSYLATSLNRPLMDEMLVAADTALGFDWVAILRATNAMPSVAGLLEHAYHSLMPQLLALPVLLAITGKAERLMEFAAVFSVSAFLTCLTMMAVPSIGPFAYFMPPPEAYSAIERFAGDVHMQDFYALRSGEPFVLSGGAGLVSFPSFHTALAILITFAVREFRLLVVPVGVLNAALIVGTIPIGGHYLVDLFAGSTIAAVSIYLVRYRGAAVSGTDAIRAKPAG